MATEAGAIFVRVGADVSNFMGGMAAVNAEMAGVKARTTSALTGTGRFGNALTMMGGKAGAAAAAIIALTVIAKKSINAFEEHEKVAVQTAKALKTTHNASKMTTTMITTIRSIQIYLIRFVAKRRLVKGNNPTTKRTLIFT